MPRRKQTNTNVVAFPGCIAEKISLSELVDRADRVPRTRLARAIIDKMELISADAPGQLTTPPKLRECVILAALINRFLFELCAVPKDPGFLL